MKNYSKYLVFTGPESSGKSTLAAWAACKYELPMVEEYARSYLENLHRKYNVKDVETMGKGQLAAEYTCIDSSRIICDTDLLTIIIWLQEKYQQVPKWMLEWFQVTSQRSYFLCAPDIPWVYDNQRENPQDRDRLFGIYRSFLEKYQKEYLIVQGTLAERKEIINSFFQNDQDN